MKSYQDTSIEASVHIAEEEADTQASVDRRYCWEAEELALYFSAVWKTTYPLPDFLSSTQVNDPIYLQSAGFC